MSGYYEITATVTRTVQGGYTSTRALPTFYLHATVQGIVSDDHARRIAVHMLQDAAGPDAEVIAHAARVQSWAVTA